MINTCVTGSRGFIGRHLIRNIMDFEISTPSHDSIKFGQRYSFDKIFFLSTYGNMSHHHNHRMMVQSNVRDVLSMLNGFTGWFCFMSSSSVLLPVQTPYSRTKRAAEEIIQSFTDIKSCIVRPYSVTGVGEQKEHLIPTLIRSCMEGEEMPFNPYPVHDFIDVEDLVSSLVQLGKYSHTGIFEIGNAIPYTNQAVLELVEKITGRKANVKQVGSLRSYDNLEWVCKGSYRAFPPKSLATSITEMVESYKHEKK